MCIISLSHTPPEIRTDDYTLETHFYESLSSLPSLLSCSTLNPHPSQTTTEKIKPNHPAVVTSRPTPTTPAGITPQPWGITPLPLARCAPPFHTTTIIHPPTTATCVLHEAQLYLPIVDACFPPIQHPLNPLSPPPLPRPSTPPFFPFSLLFLSRASGSPNLPRARESLPITV